MSLKRTFLLVIFQREVQSAKVGRPYLLRQEMILGDTPRQLHGWVNKAEAASEEVALIHLILEVKADLTGSLQAEVEEEKVLQIHLLKEVPRGVNHVEAVGVWGQAGG